MNYNIARIFPTVSLPPMLHLTMQFKYNQPALTPPSLPHSWVKKPGAKYLPS